MKVVNSTSRWPLQSMTPAGGGEQAVGGGRAAQTHDVCASKCRAHRRALRDAQHMWSMSTAWQLGRAQEQAAQLSHDSLRRCTCGWHQTPLLLTVCSYAPARTSHICLPQVCISPRHQQLHAHKCPPARKPPAAHLSSRPWPCAPAAPATAQSRRGTRAAAACHPPSCPPAGSRRHPHTCDIPYAQTYGT